MVVMNLVSKFLAFCVVALGALVILVIVSPILLLIYLIANT